MESEFADDLARQLGLTPNGTGIAPAWLQDETLTPQDGTKQELDK